jgi:hypothetical protein
MFQCINEITEKVAELNALGKTLLLIELLKKGNIDFAEISKLYVQYLEQDNRKKQDAISTLGLNLAIYSMTDKSAHGKGVRKTLHDSQLYCFEGSPFGKQLSEEFDNKEDFK